MRSFLFNTAFYGLTLVWAILLVPTLLLPRGDALRRGVHWYAGWVMGLCRHLAGIEIEIRNAERLPRSRASILVSKHMSDLDPIVTLYLLPRMTALAKKELFAIPFIGAILRKMGIVRIDRSSGKAYQHMPRVIAEVKRTQRPLIVYPEGTRTRPGEHLKLKSGAFFLQEKGDLEVVPLATNSGLHWPKGTPTRRPGKVIYEVGAPFPHQTDKAAFMELVQSRVIARSDTLMKSDPLWQRVVGDRGRGKDSQSS